MRLFLQLLIIVITTTKDSYIAHGQFWNRTAQNSYIAHGQFWNRTAQILGNCPWNGYRHEFGPNCEYQCRCSDRNQRCDLTTGNCQSGCESGWMGPGCQYANIALGMTVDSNFATSLSFINDGDINTCVTLTGNTATDSFIRVTLDTEMTIKEVSVIFKNYTLVGEFSVYAGSSSVRDDSTLCGSEVTDIEPENNRLTVLCNREMSARFITVQFSANIRTTELCEFQIPSGQMMSYMKPSMSSSQEGNNKPEYAVDGNRDRIFETKAEDNPWFYVDLETERRIEMVEIENREGYQNRIIGFQLYLSNDTNFRSDDLIYTDESTRENVRDLYRIWTNEIIARYVLVFLPGFQRQLNFRDLYVFGGCVANRCGFNCSKLCYCNENSIQSIKNEALGTCNGECSRNWQLNNGACDTSICPNGGFGFECKFDCHCDGQCDPWTGRCIEANNTCAGNYYGEICQAYNIIEGSLFTAQGNTTYGSANQTVDGNVTSCAPLVSGTGASWTVPLGNVLPVDQILIYVNESTTGFGFEVLTERDSSYLCETVRLGTGDRYLARCRNTLATHVRLRTRSTMQICEVAVIRCSDGTYGEFCENTCLCANGQPCNKTTGQCPSTFCESGYYGPRCDRECLPGRYGSNCQIQCGRCADGAVCDIFTGLCPMGCQEGWQGGRCDSECRNGTYGADCLMDCGLCLNGEACDKISGECPNGCGAGFYLQNCTKECVAGRYGYNCNETCGSCLYNQVCDSVDGTCRSGCLLGKQPPLCKTDCEHNTFGLGCRETCGDCRYNLTCNPVNGMCDVGCDPGWIVDSESACTEPCPDGFYGYNCTYPCREDVCVGEIICNKTDGGCLSGCLYPGVEPPLCEDECDDGTYGLNCVQQCGVCRDFQPCNKTDGICLDGCEEGFSGDLCQTNDFALQLSTTSTVLLIFGVILAVLGILSVLLAIWMIKRGHLSSFFNVKDKSDDSEKGTKFSRNGSIVSTKYENLAFQPDHKETIKRCDSAESGCSLSDIVKTPGTLSVEELWNFVNNPSSKVEIEKQFKDLISGLSHPCEAARKPQNIRKNRYKEIYPYDHTRVNLSPDEEGSDYINACFISGYNQPHKYIAAQGPTEEHARDFWRMIWQYNCKKIVMLTRLVENNKVKCCQYWPDDGYKQFGDLNVEFKHIENYADFDIRTFSISYKNDKREIKQFHYYSWVDKNVPEHPASMVNFWSRVQKTEADDTSPLLVHCSAGIGRTGTYIAFDYLVDQARVDGYINVSQCVQGLRHQRINMVQNQEQYMFVYESLVDVLLCPCVAIPCEEYQQTYQKLLQPDAITRKSKLELDFEALQRVSKFEDSLTASNFTGSTYESAKSKANERKNRVDYILPSDLHRPWLSSRVTDRNDYINAVFLPSQKDSRHFIVTQQPLQDTVVDFWRMVSEYKINTIVTLDSQTGKSEMHFPLEGETLTFMPYQVSYVTEIDHGSYIEKTIKLQNVEETRDKPRLIKQFECIFWCDDDKTPEDTDSILDLIDQLLIAQQKSATLPFLIQCLNGATKCGLFSVTMATIAQMKEEKRVCIQQTIKQMRIRRQQIIPNYEQYKFIHDAVTAYMKKHDATNNFFV